MMRRGLPTLLTAIYSVTALALAFKDADSFLEGLTTLLAALGLLALIFIALHLIPRR